ncbi:sigma factor-like helix-turn-helix DNA-binding protein, partial [Herminiimonas sp.]|uniref:sigma factor-like helix-turn-helix DNA-binding protein n=1 Tax=Herminiimonas sp. TaxID=1926289 RepID=UPI002717C38F
LSIDRLLDDLGPRTRQIFLLAQIEELSYVEIAKRMNVSLPTVKKHLVRAYTECLVLAAS